MHCAENNSISLKGFLSLLSSLFSFLFDNLVSVLCLFASLSRVVGGRVGFEAIVDLDLERFFSLGCRSFGGFPDPLLLGSGFW